jgi:hypothetical protein
MSLLHSLMGDPATKQYYLEEEQLEDLRDAFEHYLFSLHEKVAVIAQILNKAHCIRKRDRGYIKADENVIWKSKDEIHRNNQEKKLAFYFKGWVNRRLKRVLKLIKLEIKSPYGLDTELEDIAECVRQIRTHMEGHADYAEVVALQRLAQQLQVLERTLNEQKQILEHIYPLKEWSLHAHTNIFPETFLTLIAREIKVLFAGKGPIPGDYNLYQGLVSQALHTHDLPADTMIRRLLDHRIEKVKTIRSVEKEPRKKLYHGRPIYMTTPLIPLKIKGKNAGFFVDTDPWECVIIIQQIYGIQRHDIELFEIDIPKSFFKRFIQDTHSADGYRGRTQAANSYVLRPTDFPDFNELFLKGLIKTKTIRVPLISGK